MILQTWLLLTAIFTLSGCFGSDKARDQFENYQQRLANVLDTEPVRLGESLYIELPRKRDLLLPIDDVRMGLLDAYELRACGLFQLIADRNSILGKVQDAFRQLDYEIKLIATLEACIAAVAEPSLKTQLESAYAQKRQQLPSVYFNTLIGSDAWRQQLSPSTPNMLPPDGSFTHSEAALAITSFARLLEAPVDVSQLQEPIEKQRYLGALFLSMDESTRWLNATTAQLYRDDLLVICGENKDPTRLNYLRNVFNKFFIGEVQPYLSKLGSAYLSIEPALVQIKQNLPEKTALEPYQAAYFSGAHYQMFQKAVKDHVGYWQQLFKRCSIEVGR